MYQMSNENRISIVLQLFDLTEFDSYERVEVAEVNGQLWIKVPEAWDAVIYDRMHPKGRFSWADAVGAPRTGWTEPVRALKLRELLASSSGELLLSTAGGRLRGYRRTGPGVIELVGEVDVD